MADIVLPQSAENPPVAGLHDDLVRLGTATLFEASKLPIALPSRLRPTWPGATAMGRALPVACVAGDNLALHVAIERAQAGDILVVDAQNAPHGYWGEVMAVAAMARGIRGLVIDGGVRDTARLEALGFPVWSSHVAILGTGKTSSGVIGQPIVLGTATVREGDVVVADADGVVSMSASEVARIHQAGLAREAAEEAHFERLRAGETTMEIYALPRDV
ncbi:4-carboxy-4-hydroxy-2-oxoadipate aldolase/oxaloacetate decarboxylase [Microbacterium sp. NPDC096154]|uniref:4-carboxy-4-hydroxy-2-oxoadipate aldolase/oxaloacetate decarboxylase n=1 Tax=Microbacterium sp. NPDC096154 TaxID=3155549 RepID=UPI003334180C